MSPAISPAPAKNPRADGMGYNPRCLRRDISNKLSSQYSRTEDIVKLVTGSANVGTFQNTLQSTAPINVHVAGHFTISGDPGGDFYVSPGDPAFCEFRLFLSRFRVSLGCLTGYRRASPCHD